MGINRYSLIDLTYNENGLQSIMQPAENSIKARILTDSSNWLLATNWRPSLTNIHYLFKKNKEQKS